VSGISHLTTKTWTTMAEHVDRPAPVAGHSHPAQQTPPGSERSCRTERDDWLDGTADVGLFGD